MSFYVWDTPEVSKFFNAEYSSKHHFYVSTDGTRNTVYKDDSRTFIGKSSIGQMKLLGIPEYKLHPRHGLIPKDSKLFIADAKTTDVESNQPSQSIQPYQKEDNETMNQKEEFPVVGQKVLVKGNTITDSVICPVAQACLNRECIVMSKFKYYNQDVVAVCLDEFSGCAVFRADMCRPIKTERQKQIDKIADILVDNGQVSWELAEYLYDAGLRFKDGSEQG